MWQVAPRELYVADFVVGNQEGALPNGVAGIGHRQPVENPERAPIRVQRNGEIALRRLDVADLLVRNSQHALPVGISGIRQREAVEYREFLLVGSKRCGQVALRPLRVADLRQAIARSRCQPAWFGSDRARRLMICSLAWYDFSARPVRSPCAMRISPIRSSLMPTSYCH